MFKHLATHTCQCNGGGGGWLCLRGGVKGEGMMGGRGKLERIIEVINYLAYTY